MNAEKPLAGKVALITGAARRSGRATAIKLAADGAAVAINTRRSADAANEVKKEIEAQGGTANVYVCDITGEDAVIDMVKAITTDFGGIDILVNNAADRARVPTLELSLAEWKRVINIILDGAFLCTRAVLPHMMENKWGRIINISGDGNHAAFTERAHVHAGKGGLEAMTRSLSSEFCDQGITVNTVSPGRIGRRTLKNFRPVTEECRRHPAGRFRRRTR